ncbi:MAG: ABC transporter permease [Myxococcales bacterium]|nr:ABC transporter permease [Myxococcales bacterium]
MNLAYLDLRHQLRRFVATAFGLGLLFAIVLAMGGIYRGMVEDAVVLVERSGADLWLVQRGTRGPFAERSTVPAVLEDRARAVAGVAWAHPFSSFTLEPEHAGRSLRLTLVGLGWPDDRGASIGVTRGRALERSRGEIVVDASLGLALGETLTLGDDPYRVVGLGAGLVASGGDPLGFVTHADLERIQSYLAADARRALPPGDGDAAPSGPQAILVRVAPGTSVAAVRGRFASFTDVDVYSQSDERSFLLEGVVDKARRQIGLFRGLLALVSGIVVSLVVFNMTVAKTREIALLKLMGARTRLIVSMIVQQALLLSVLAYGVAFAASQVAFGLFPRRVVVGPEELAGVFVLAVGIALVASLAAVRRALQIPPTTILAG